MLRKYFTAHPAEIGETYFEHFGLALGFSGAMFRGAFVCLVHAVVPGLFVRTGSGIIDRLHQQMVKNRARGPMTNENPAPGGVRASDPLSGRKRRSAGSVLLCAAIAIAILGLAWGSALRGTIHAALSSITATGRLDRLPHPAS
jgi:hypothetical protein